MARLDTRRANPGRPIVARQEQRVGIGAAVDAIAEVICREDQTVGRPHAATYRLPDPSCTVSSRCRRKLSLPPRADRIAAPLPVRVVPRRRPRVDASLPVSDRAGPPSISNASRFAAPLRTGRALAGRCVDERPPVLLGR